MRKMYVSIIAVLIAALLVSFFYLTTQLSTATSGSSIGSSSSSVNYPKNTDTAFGGLFASNNIDQSLSYSKYKAIEDSINRIKQGREVSNASNGDEGTGYTHIGLSIIKRDGAGFFQNKEPNDGLLKKISDSLHGISKQKYAAIGIDSFKKLDSVEQNIYSRYHQRQKILNDLTQENGDKNELYYLTLNNYTFGNNYDTKFYVDKDTYNLVYVKWDSVTRKGADSTKHGHYESKQIPVRYNESGKKVLVPITRKQYHSLEIVFNFFFYASAFVGLYIFLGLPIQFIVNISRGHAFTQQNINSFKYMGYAVLFYEILDVITPHILHFYFRNTIPADFKLPNILNNIGNIIFMVLLSLAFFTIAKAFKKGLSIQQEQDLTV